MNTEELLDRITIDKVKYVQMQFTDLLGVVKNLTIPAKHLPDALENGVWFDGSSIEGFARICESDMFLKPDLDTYALIPWLSTDEGHNTARFICDVHRPDGSPFEGDPRYILKKVLAELEEMGFVFNTGPELEFFLFRKENGCIRPLPHDNAGYFDLTNDQAYRIRMDMMMALERFGIDVELSHHEVAAGQHEIDFRYGDALSTADSAITLRFVLKAIAQQNDLHVTFMPKPIAGINGSGMHVHQSFASMEDGSNGFHDDSDEYGLSKNAYHFIAGQLAHMKDMAAILCPTVNSYKRLVPGYEAPVYVSWGRINRSALIRVPMIFTGKTQSTRIELRCPDPTSNIYLAFAVMLKAGLEGIKNKMEPPAATEENLYDFSDEKLQELKIETIPGSLWEALQVMKQSELMKEALGPFAFERYIEAKKAECRDYAMQVTPWEIEKYLEMY